MIINKKSNTGLSGFYMVYQGSTNLEKDGWRGISHLGEHLKCKVLDDLQEDFDRDGIDFNAYTSDSYIVFYINGLNDRVSKWRDTFVERLSKFTVTEEEFELERKIVLEEYMDYFNDQSSSHSLNISRKLFNYANAIGTKSDLESMEFSDIKEFFELQYSKPTYIVNISSDDYINNTIEFSELNKQLTLEQIENNNVELEINNNFKDKTSVIILSKVITDDFAYVNFINTMLSYGLSSPLYQEVREKRGLVYYINSYLNTVGDSGVNTISTLTSNENVTELIDTVKYVLSNKDKFITEERFNIIKDFHKVRIEKSKILNHANVMEHILPKNRLISSILDTITFEKVNEIYDKYFNFDTMYISTDKEEFSDYYDF